MKDDLSLDDLWLFSAVCEAGGLAGAVPVTGQSAPTLSRKMAGLERRTGRRLFSRGPQGYALTSDGRALLQELGPLGEIRRRLEGWSAGNAPFRVRITAGRATSRWLVRNFATFRPSDASWIPEFVSSNAIVDIARREADFGFRNVEPTQSWLAARRTRTIRWAEYARGPEVRDFVAMSEDSVSTRSTRWVRDNRGERVVTTVSDAGLALELTLAGVTRMLLPTFVGDEEDGLTRVSDPIPELTHGEWLVTHHDARHDPPIRAAIDAIIGFIEGQGS